jgi:aspartate kinase
LETVATLNDLESVHYQSAVKIYESLVQAICEDHIKAAQSTVTDPELLASLIEQIQKECKEILDYREAAERWHLEIDWRSKDRIVSFGEKLSCRFMTVLLRDRVSARYIR